MAKVAIVGAGTAGSATALLLTRAGHEVHVFERVPSPSAVGAGIVLQPTGRAVLGRLGLEASVVAHGARLEGLTCLREDGRPIVDLSYATWNEHEFGLGLHRGVLFEVLFRALVAALADGGALHLGVDVDRFELDARGRPRLFDPRGVALGDFDLLVVADGARSHLRERWPHVEFARAYPWGALWFIGEDAAPTFAKRLVQHVDGTDVMVGFLPTGFGPDARKVHRTSLYWSVRLDRVEALRRAGLAAWKGRVLRYEPRAEALLTQIDDFDQVVVAQYTDVQMRRWADGRVVFLGDAAHATSPQLGQGCNLALLDALTLAECMHAFGGDARVVEALATYEHRRRAHLRFYQRATRLLTPFFQGDSSLLATLRDVGMPIGGALPFGRRLMTASMAGVLESWFGAERALPPRESLVPGG